MAGPFIFVGSHRVRGGKLEELRADAVSLAKFVEDREPQLLGFNIYLSEDGTEATVVQIHPDAESMLTHMQVAVEHIEKGAEELLETQEIRIFGTPNTAVLDMIAQLTQTGVPIHVQPSHLAGFTR
jgi:hypothetical protein